MVSSVRYTPARVGGVGGGLLSTSCLVAVSFLVPPTNVDLKVVANPSVASPVGSVSVDLSPFSGSNSFVAGRGGWSRLLKGGRNVWSLEADDSVEAFWTPRLMELRDSRRAFLDGQDVLDDVEGGALTKGGEQHYYWGVLPASTESLGLTWVRFLGGGSGGGRRMKMLDDLSGRCMVVEGACSSGPRGGAIMNEAIELSGDADVETRLVQAASFFFTMSERLGLTARDERLSMYYYSKVNGWPLKIVANDSYKTFYVTIDVVRKGANKLSNMTQFVLFELTRTSCKEIGTSSVFAQLSSADQLQTHQAINYVNCKFALEIQAEGQRQSRIPPPLPRRFHQWTQTKTDLQHLNFLKSQTLKSVPLVQSIARTLSLKDILALGDTQAAPTAPETTEAASTASGTAPLSNTATAPSVSKTSTLRSVSLVQSIARNFSSKDTAARSKTEATAPASETARVVTPDTVFATAAESGAYFWECNPQLLKTIRSFEGFKKLTGPKELLISRQVAPFLHIARKGTPNAGVYLFNDPQSGWNILLRQYRDNTAEEDPRHYGLALTKVGGVNHLHWVDLDKLTSADTQNAICDFRDSMRRIRFSNTPSLMLATPTFENKWDYSVFRT